MTADTVPAVPLEPRPADWWEEDAAEAGRADRRHWDDLYDRDEE
ncbi:hypothetical protein [Streptomyces sp. 351MFTsu5.1]|nr:hypothetical protein [Streptomyces sp. 351MFTsu5.1]